MWFWLFCFSCLVNVILLFYARWLIKTIAFMNEDLESATDQIKQFLEHVKSLHELEMFYGDQTLKSLMDHATQLTKTLSGVDLILNQIEEKDEDTEKTTPPNEE